MMIGHLSPLRFNFCGRMATLVFVIFLFFLPEASLAGTETGAVPMRYFLQPKDAQGSLTPYGDNRVAGRTVLSEGAKLYYEAYGAGKPLFVLHGGGVGSPYELGRIIDALRGRFQVIVLSSRGHGHSEIGRGPVTLEQKVRDVLTVMREVTDAPAPLLGFSDGAYTAYALAAMNPQSVEAIIAIGAGTLKPGFFPETLSVADLERLDGAYVAQMRALMPEPDRLQEFLNSYMAFWHKARIGKELLSAVTCPVLLMSGDRDTHAPAETVLEASRLMPRAQLCIVPHAGHTAFLDQYPVVMAAIEQFLQAIYTERTEGVVDRKAEGAHR